MGFAFGAAILAGLIAGAIMAGPVYLQRAPGVDVKQGIFRTWGVPQRLHGAPGYLAGFLFHQALAAAITLVYALGFRVLGATDHLWLWGLLGGALHHAIAGDVVDLLPAVHPEIPERIPVQGAYYRNYGPLDVGTFITGYLTFELLVGLLYGLFTGGARP